MCNKYEYVLKGPDLIDCSEKLGSRVLQTYFMRYVVIKTPKKKTMIFFLPNL